jgi:hypothetical protein
LIPDVLSSFDTTWTAATTGMVTFEILNWKDGDPDTDLENYIDNVRMYPQNPTLIAEQREIDSSTGGTATFTIDAGPAYANKWYLVLSGFSGNHPGFTLNGTHIPLNQDLWTTLAVSFALQGFWVGFYTSLDASGQSTAILNTFGPQPSVQGVALNFCYMVLQNPTNSPIFASNPIYVLFL